MRCVKCPGEGIQRYLVDDAGETIARGYMCDPCMDAALVELGELRAQFQAMIDAGVDRTAANRLMIRRIEGKETE
jgi:hypothetical protein